MITFESARALVTKELARHMLDSSDDVELAIVDSGTLEYSWGWVFFYNSVAYIESGSNLERLAGNAPFIVERETGRLLETGTAHSIESYIAAYERSGNPHS